ncbi:tape measure protein [Pasteurella multocida]|uniref:tape measure protein n=1 Tax=Pasteurella multocida TaxID=747 RepID=UPI00028288AE|nr:tape measure protein [Pasteurella multocida]ARB74160.1 phage tail protein [Pasteurella multocida]EJZ77320.1 putative bacteriophage TM4 gp14 like-protein [Pasteurella multocida subsp. gallicida X73]OBP29168.1 phage tail protein [Pasteurella multocida subsp. multocida]URH93430.1 tape measure protein [Pasteurella multocida]URH99803.1 tape measure protein [Pasteurella multocida]
MSNLTLALKIKADLNNALNNFKALETELQRTGKSAGALGAKSGIGAKGLDNLGKQADSVTNKLGKTRAGIESISRQLARLQHFSTGLIGINIGASGIQSLFNTADAYNNYEARIRLVSRSNKEAQGTFRELMQVANDTGQLFEATAELYTRVYRSMGSNANNAEILQFTKTIQQALVVSGAGAQEAKAALIQLSQGLASGTLRGEEFNSVAEQAPVILEILQKSLGKTRGELRKMAEDGKLTPQLILAATKEAQEQIQAQYDQMPKTISRAVNELSNAWLQFIGQADNASSASSLIASSISALASSLDELGTIAIVVSTALGVRLLAALTKKTIAYIQEQGAATKSMLATRAKAQIDVMAARSAHIAAVKELELARAKDAGYASSKRLTLAMQTEEAASKRLALAKGMLAKAEASAGLASRIGSGALTFVGGGFGAAVLATLGLIAVYQYLKAKEEELEAQYNQTLSSIQSHIDKTEELIEARQRLGEIGGFSDRMAQLESNKKALDDAQKELELLKAKRAQLQEINQTNGFGLADTSKLDEYNKKIKELEDVIARLTGKTKEIGNITESQLAAAFEAAVEQGGALAEKLREIGDANAKEAIELLTPVIKDAEEQMKSASSELDEINVKLGKELVNVTQTAKEQLLSLGEKFMAMARDAGLSGQVLDTFNKKLEENLKLIDEIDNAKIAKDNEKFFGDLSKRARQAKMTTEERLVDDINHREGATPEQIAQALKDAKAIAEGEKYRKSKNKKTKYDADAKNLELNIQYLRLTGQEVKANLTDIEGRYNKLLAEFQKAGNVEGINLIKKVLPLEQAKVQIDGVQAEINRLFQNQSAQEQRIQSQVNTGLISHLEGQRQLKEVYAQTVTEIEKQLPLLEKLSQMPGAQGEQARNMLEQMKLKIVELKSAGNDLEKAFKDGLTQGIQSSLMGLAQGTMTLRDAIKNLALTIVNSMVQIAAQQLAMQATSAIGGLFGAVGGVVTAATGGYITGPGTGTSDSIPARLSNGEYVIRAASVSRYGVDFLHAINRGQLRKYSTGGLVSMPKVSAGKEPGLTQAMQNNSGVHAVASPVHIQQTLAVDSAELFTAGINTHAGEQAVLTVIRANKQTLKQDLS